MPSLAADARNTASAAPRSSGVPPSSAMFLHAIVEACTDSLRAGSDQLVHHAGVEGAGRDAVDVDAVVLHVEGHALGKTDDGGLRRGVGGDARQWRGGAAARQLDDLAVTAAA